MREESMKRICFIVLLALIFFATGAFAADFKVTSPDLKENGVLPNKYVFNKFGCTGDNISPQLTWAGEPAGTKSFAVTVFDPDAPTGSGWWHWLVFNIPATIHTLPEDSGNPDNMSLPSGAVEARTDFGTNGYGGACPPAGAKPHRYQFTVYALNIDHLPLTEDASGAMIGFNMNNHILAKAVLTVTYGR